MSRPRPAPRTLRVTGSHHVTPNMLRITLGGAEMANFPADQESAYVKLIFPQGEDQKRIMRTYTISHQRQHEVDIDFVLHEEAGPASNWARTARPGDDILIGGPGPKKLVATDVDWVLLVGDMTALPALSVNIEQLPADTRGYAVIEVIDERDIQSLKKPENLHIHWLVNPHPGEDSQLLLNRVRELGWLDGKAGVWAACEFSSMRALRSYFKEERQVDRDTLYISSYWKLGSSEEQHKAAKREDADKAD